MYCTYDTDWYNNLVHDRIKRRIIRGGHVQFGLWMFFFILRPIDTVAYSTTKISLHPNGIICFSNKLKVKLLNSLELESE